MNLSNIFESTDFVHASGTKDELQVAEFLKAQCEALGVPARLEAFRVAMGEIESAHLFADGKEITCKAFNCCGSGSVEGELYYMPGTDPVSIAGAKDKIVGSWIFCLSGPDESRSKGNYFPVRKYVLSKYRY